MSTTKKSDELIVQRKEQNTFDSKYITGHEICNELGITRSAVVSARKRGILPPPIVVPGSRTHLWVRSQVWKRISRWKTSIEDRQAGNAA